MGTIEPDDLPPGLPSVHVPDDARELDADRLAYYRELAARRRAEERAARPPRHPSRGPHPSSRPDPGGGPLPWPPTDPAGRTGSPSTILLGGLIAMALLAAVMVVLAPRPGTTPAALPLASPSAAVGEAGGLLPEATVTLGGQDRSLRDARPVVLATLPADGCAQTCEDALRSVVRQAGQARVRVALIGPPAQEELMQDVARATMSGAPVLVDPAGALDAAYGLSGTSLVLVHADGVVADVLRDVGPAPAVEATLAVLDEPGAGTPVSDPSAGTGR